MEDDMRSVFTKEKPVMALLNLKSRGTENYASEISDEIDTTYAHTVKILGRLEDLGLVTSAGRKGRKKMLKLTDSGEQLAEKAHEFVAVLDEVSRKQGDA